MKTKLLLLAAVLILNFEIEISNCSAQAPAIQWQKCLGGTADDLANSIQQTADGGYIVAGISYSINGDVTGHHGDTTTSDAWVVKLDSNANIQWQKSYGGSAEDYANDIELTNDGGYVMVGITNSTDGDVSGNHGGSDYWVVKLDASGNIQWQACLGGSGADFGYSIEQTTDNGYIVAGSSQSTDGQVTGHHPQYYGAEDYWVVKLSSTGALQWENCFGGEAEDDAYSVRQLKDGGYIVGGATYSNEGNVTGSHDTIYSGTLYPDVWLLKLNSAGNLLWEKCYGGYNLDIGNCTQLTSDNGFIVTAYTGSDDGDVTGYHYAGDYWVVKIDSTGEIQWENCFGGNSTDFGQFGKQTKDSGYIIAGTSVSDDGDVTGNHGDYDMWVFKLSSNGGLEWEKSLGGSNSDGAMWTMQAKDGGYVVAGNTSSTDGDVTGLIGNDDFWIVKLFPDVPTDVNKLEVGGWKLEVYPNPANDEITVMGNNISPSTLYSITDMVGRTILSGNLNSNTNIINISSLTAGVYILQTGNDYKQTFKIVKE